MSESVAAVIEAVPHARAAVAEYASRVGVAGDQLDAVRLAVNEAVSNVVRHAYPDGGGVVQWVAAVVGRELWVLVADDGCGYRSPSRIPGGGWGLRLIEQMCDQVTLTERAAGGTDVRMRFGMGLSSADRMPVV